MVVMPGLEVQRVGALGRRVLNKDGRRIRRTALATARAHPLAGTGMMRCEMQRDGDGAMLKRPRQHIEFFAMVKLAIAMSGPVWTCLAAGEPRLRLPLRGAGWR